ncbi:MAG: class I SAM-dependent methyltransferase [Chloroflexota bacterium]|nr:MAG: class I SAM-dependent methyltransferase [Chloroflexota bacterium]
MSMKTILRLLGIFMILDGVLSLLFGKTYLRPWRRLGGPISVYISFLLRWPDWLIRVAGAGEAVVGARTFAATRVQVSEIYGVFAPLYDPFLALWNATLARGVDAAVDQAVSEYLPPGGRVLDLGCGTGANLARLQRLGIPFSQYVGVDLTPRMLAVAQSKLGHLPNVTFLQRDLLRDPLPDGEFDLVISTWVFSHLGRKADEVVEKARGRLKPGGHMVLLISSRTDSWLDSLLKSIEKAILAEPVPQELYLSFPGRVALQRLAGGLATLVVLRKET